MPLYHSAASGAALGPSMLSGASFAIGNRFSPRTYWKEIHDSEATVFQYVGETCRYLLSAPPSPYDTNHKVRLAVGNGMRPDIWDAFKKRFNIPVIAEFYGATEGAGVTFNYQSGEYGMGAVGSYGWLMNRFLTNAGWVVVQVDPLSEIPSRDKNVCCILILGILHPMR